MQTYQFPALGINSDGSPYIPTYQKHMNETIELAHKLGQKTMQAAIMRMLREREQTTETQEIFDAIDALPLTPYEFTN